MGAVQLFLKGHEATSSQPIWLMILNFYFGQIELSRSEATGLGQHLAQTYCFIEEQYFTQIKLQIVYK